MTDQETRAFLDRFVAWMAASETNMEKWYRGLYWQVGLGIARCAELQTFNTRSVALYEWQKWFLDKLKTAGADVPLVPTPRAFVVSEACLGGYASPLTTRVSCAPLPGPTKALPDSGQLGFVAAVAGACATNPVTAVACVAATAIILYGIYKTAKIVFTDAETQEANAAIAQAAAEQDARRVAVMNDCIAKQLKGLSAADAANLPKRQAIYDQCAAIAAKLVPDRKQPWAETHSVWFAVGLGAVAIGLGAVLAGIGVRLGKGGHVSRHDFNPMEAA